MTYAHAISNKNVAQGFYFQTIYGSCDERASNDTGVVRTNHELPFYAKMRFHRWLH